MRMRLMLLGGGNALGQALIRLGAEEDIGFLAPRPPQDGWDAASLTQLLDDTRPDALINLAYYFDWFQAETVSENRLAGQERAIERLAELCQHHNIILVQPSSYRVFDGSRATAYSEKDEPVPLGLRGQTRLDVAQRLAKRQLRERHRVELVQAREALDLVLAVVASHATPKRRQRQVCHDLRKYELALMHRHPERGSPAMGSKSAARRSNRDQTRRTNYLGRSSTYQRLACGRWDTTGPK